MAGVHQQPEQSNYLAEGQTEQLIQPNKLSSFEGLHSSKMLKALPAWQAAGSKTWSFGEQAAMAPNASYTTNSFCLT